MNVLKRKHRGTGGLTILHMKTNPHKSFLDEVTVEDMSMRPGYTPHFQALSDVVNDPPVPVQIHSSSPLVFAATGVAPSCQFLDHNASPVFEVHKVLKHFLVEANESAGVLASRIASFFGSYGLTSFAHIPQVGVRRVCRSGAGPLATGRQDERGVQQLAGHPLPLASTGRGPFSH